jgi:hypothetical protein
MIKQFFVIGLAAIMFIGVWVLVLLQFNQQQATIDIETISFEVSEERVFDFPESIKADDGTELKENEQTLKKEIKEEFTSNELVHKKFDLRDYDFSDISTSEGVPISVILDKLKLE